MKTLLTIFTLVFTVMFSSTSWGGWTKVWKDVRGNTFYVDFETIRKHEGYIYFWVLSDYLNPTIYGGFFSSKIYIQGDCKLFRSNELSWSHYKEPMGGGTGDTPPIPKEHKDWNYPTPNSVSEIMLRKVCSR